MTLELKYVVGYLGTNLTVKLKVGKLSGYKYEILTGQRLDSLSMYKYFKPILRPLSDLTKEIEVNGEKFVPKIELEKLGTIPLSINYYYHSQILKLLEWHFDVYGLIEKGLAIDKNTIL